MTAFSPELERGEPSEPRPDAVLVPGWLTLAQQEWIVGQFHEWASGHVPIRAAKVRGHEMSVRTVYLG
jgi:DNA oxidative demethylase